MIASCFVFKIWTVFPRIIQSVHYWQRFQIAVHTMHIVPLFETIIASFDLFSRLRVDNSNREDMCPGTTTGPPGTTMAGTGPCGSCPCMGALTQPKYWTRSGSARRNTRKPSFGSLDSTMCAKCNASVSSPTSPQGQTKCDGFLFT